MKNKDKEIDKRNEEKDNRVVASMNIDGMPWHVPGKRLYDESKEPMPVLDKKELRRLTLNATLSGLVVGAVFLIVFFLFILFSIHIWF